MRTKKPTVQKNPVSSRSISKKVKEKTPLDKTKTVTDRDKRKYIDYKIKVKKGDPFDTEMLNSRLNMDEDAVSSLYLDEGFLFFNAQPTIQKIEEDSIDIQMRISEGKRFSINKV